MIPCLHVPLDLHHTTGFQFLKRSSLKNSGTFTTKPSGVLKRLREHEGAYLSMRIHVCVCVCEFKYLLMDFYMRWWNCVECVYVKNVYVLKMCTHLRIYVY